MVESKNVTLATSCDPAICKKDLPLVCMLIDQIGQKSDNLADHAYDLCKIMDCSLRGDDRANDSLHTLIPDIHYDKTGGLYYYRDGKLVPGLHLANNAPQHLTAVEQEKYITEVIIPSIASMTVAKLNDSVGQYYSDLIKPDAAKALLNICDAAQKIAHDRDTERDKMLRRRLLTVLDEANLNA